MKQSAIKRQRLWQYTVILTLFIAYPLNYFTRNHLYVTTDAFKHYLDPNNDQMAQKWLAMMYTTGWIAFVVSHLLVSFYLDFQSNRGVKTLAFGLISTPILVIFTALIRIPNNLNLRIAVCMILWNLMRASQAPQWAGLLKILSNWTGYKQYGRALSLMSCGSLLGDACSRFVFGWILRFTFFDDSWRNVFYFGSFMTLIGVVPLLLLVKDTPVQRGLMAYPENPENVYSHQKHSKQIQTYQAVGTEVSDDEKQTNKTNSKMWRLCRPLLTEPMMYFLVAMKFQIAFMREYFNVFGAVYLQSIGASMSNAALISGLFPLCGGFGSLLNGFYLDWMLKKRRNVLRYALFPTQAVVCVFVFVSFYEHPSEMLWSFVVRQWLAGFAIFGSYSMMSVLSLDLGGHTSPVIVSAVGDFGSNTAFALMPLLSAFGGYAFLFRILTITAVVHLLTSIGLVVYVRYRHRSKRNRVHGLLLAQAIKVEV